MAWSRTEQPTNAGATSNASFTWAASPTQGDLLVAWADSDTTVAMSSSGWTAGPNVVDNNAAYCWWKVAGASESSTVAFTNSAANWAIGGLHYTGNAASPFDTSNSASAVSSANTTSPAVSITAAQNGELVVAMSLDHGVTTSTMPNTPSWSSGFSNVQTVTQGTAPGATTCVTFVGENTNASAGTVSPNVTWSQNLTNRQILVLAFNLAAAAASAPPAVYVSTAAVVRASTW